jgi:phosphatidylglycerol:prolipoprotein diacylglycerol transferase
VQPILFGFQSYFMAWVVAAGVGFWAAMRVTRREGLPDGKSFCAWALLALTILVGSKLLYLVEHTFYPLDDPDPTLQAGLTGLAWHGYRITGGMLLVVPVLPLVCRMLGLPTLKFADAVAPSGAIATGIIRIGCFLNGCCFGRFTDGLLGVSFPRGSRAWAWQYAHGYITAATPRALPVVPLELFFAALGFLLYFLDLHWLYSRQYDGQVWARSYLVFFGVTFILEGLRPTLLHLNLMLTAGAVVLAAAMLYQFRAAALVGPRLTSPAVKRST